MCPAVKQVCHHHPYLRNGATHDDILCCNAGVMEVVLDRKLSKDDNRGLGHGVSDNKVTLSSFRLLVEHRSSPDHNVSHTVLFLGCILLQLQVHTFV